MQKSVEYLGHKLDASGLHPTTAKIKAVVDAPTQKNLNELKSYLWQGRQSRCDKWGKSLTTFQDQLKNSIDLIFKL